METFVLCWILLSGIRFYMLSSQFPATKIYFVRNVLRKRELRDFRSCLFLLRNYYLFVGDTMSH
jgi:hypothetical protein